MVHKAFRIICVRPVRLGPAPDVVDGVGFKMLGERIDQTCWART